MHTRIHSRVISCLALLCAIGGSRPALAAWPHRPEINVPICTAAGAQQFARIASDGAGGALYTWSDYRGGGQGDIYVQRVPASGVIDPAWPADGRALCTAVGDQSDPAIVSDGAGGAIVAWSDSRGGAGGDIYAQRVLASGVVDPGWPVDGRALCTASANQQSVSMVSDGAGGAIITWMDYRGFVDADIYAQHVLVSGVVDPAWPVDGRALCTASLDQTYPRIVSDGAGGAIVTWTDSRSGSADIYAQRVLASGSLGAGWPSDGRAVCTAANSESDPTIATDGSGGAIITWVDNRLGTDIYAQHVRASGAVDDNWTADGVALCTASSSQVGPAIVSDGVGGAIVTWSDNRSPGADVYAQHVLATGVVDGAWPVDGRALCTATSFQQNPTIVSDGAGGAIVAWGDLRDLYSDIYAQHVLASGALDGTWPVNGRAVSTAVTSQSVPCIVSDGDGGAVIAWHDFRRGTNDIYSQRVARFGYLGTPEAEIASVRDVPNDEGGKVKVSWIPSYLDTESDPDLDFYEIYRSVPPQAATQALAAGARLLAPSEAPGRGARSFLATTSGAATLYWEYLATQNALHYLPGYSYLSATTGDSTGVYNPTTSFMIVARNTAGDRYWLSVPVAGYSVDNLPPGTPTPFTGQYAGGATRLHWNPNPEPDVAVYRLHRGTSASFVPDPGNLMAEQPDTGYVDVGEAGHYYKLSAADIHGNQSGFALLTPAQITGVPGNSTASELILARPSPNPASRAATIRFTLLRAGRARLAVYDAAGRQVRVLASGIRPAGEHAVVWDLRDESGRAAPSGLYVVRLDAGGRQLSQRLTTFR